jgi:ankyrin repeat protein
VNFEGRLGSDGRSACHVAVERGNVALVEFLLSEQLMKPDQVVFCKAPRNIHHDTRTQIKDTCLHIAARNNDWDLFSTMMNYYSKDEFAKLMTELKNDLGQDPLYPLLETFFSLQTKFKGFLAL